ncbi:outer membrane assembly protein AsmA [Enterobacteriaceae bacterium LUAb1]
MRRLVTTLAILLVVIVAGITALVLLINPNEFRAYLVNQVKQRSGYQLELQGDLRWHVWPQLSILAGRMSLMAPGAKQPMISAENMRLDVYLLPLLSHQLLVKQVMLKGAVIRLTPGSVEHQPGDAPVAPGNTSDISSIAPDWTFDIAGLKMVDSLLVWQQPDGEQLNFRDIDLSLSQDVHKQAHIELSSRISRNQRDLRVNLTADLNGERYPRQLSASVGRLGYTLTGVDLPGQGISGQLSIDAQWYDNNTFLLNNLIFSANDTQLTGNVRGSLSTTKTLDIKLQASNLNVDSLLGMNSREDTSDIQKGISSRRPVIAEAVASDPADDLLNQFMARVDLAVDALHWRGMAFTHVRLAAENQRGKIVIKQFDGESGKGKFSLPGYLDFRNKVPWITLRPTLDNMAVEPLLKAFALPDLLQGNLSMKGEFSGNGLDINTIKQRWKGNAEMSMTDVRLSGLNFVQLISRAVTNSSDRISGEESDTDYTELKQMQASLILDNGTVTLDKLTGGAARLDITGKGNADIVRHQCDFSFAITVSGGWRGESQITRILSQAAIPLNVYGRWDALNYKVNIDRILRQQLEDKAKKRIQNWTDQNLHK